MKSKIKKAQSKKARQSTIALSIFVILLASVFLILPGENKDNRITGHAANEQVINAYPQLFKHTSERNANLLTALESISAEFNKQGVQMTAELLAATIATLDKEVGVYSYISVEEFGDYCMGPGCTFGISGSCRSEQYNGGCDYKGRGYIQITHEYNYRSYCGEECLVGSDKDVCDCKGKDYCAVKDIDICKPAKALLPEYAGRIFAAYYKSRDLHNLANKKDFWNVGKRINGGDVYADEFEIIANDWLSLLNRYPDKTKDFLDYLNSGKASIPSKEENGEKPITGPIEEITRPVVNFDIDKMHVVPGTFGVYSVLPMFRAEVKYDFNEYNDVVAYAVQLVNDVKECTGEDNITAEMIHDCVTSNKPGLWKIQESDKGKYAFFVPGTDNSPSYQFALYFGEITYIEP